MAHCPSSTCEGWTANWRGKKFSKKNKGNGRGAKEESKKQRGEKPDKAQKEIQISSPTANDSCKREHQFHPNSRKNRDANQKTFLRDPGLLLGGLFLHREN
jgi:hypothetical protein